MKPIKTITDYKEVRTCLISDKVPTSEKPQKKLNHPGGSDGKASVYNAGDLGSSPALGRSPGERNGNPLQYYCLENPMNRGAW